MVSVFMSMTNASSSSAALFSFIKASFSSCKTSRQSSVSYSSPVSSNVLVSTAPPIIIHARIIYITQLDFLLQFFFHLFKLLFLPVNLPANHWSHILPPYHQMYL